MADYSYRTDQELITFLQDADRRAFDEIYARYWKKLLLYAGKVVRDQNEAYVNKLCVDNLPGWDSGDIAAQSDEAPEDAPLMTGELTEESVDYWSVGQNNFY